MLFNNQLKAIREAKDRLALRGQLHRGVIRLELYTAIQEMRQTLLQATAGLSGIKFALGLLDALRRRG